MYDPEHQRRAHQVLIFLLALYPVGLVRTLFLLRSQKGKALPLPFKIAMFVIPFFVPLGILVYLLSDGQASQGTPLSRGQVLH
ncbi:MAG: hypothetical protein PHW13_09905 [Methylococcales bacterium]|nr:hypothetical protein [Methylococcales bacterium]